jgi:hypothetical protein
VGTQSRRICRDKDGRLAPRLVPTPARLHEEIGFIVSLTGASYAPSFQVNAFTSVRGTHPERSRCVGRTLHFNAIKLRINY